MCYFEQIRWDCGYWKWGNFRAQCNKEYRTGETCGLKLVYNTVYASTHCKLCYQIVKKERRLRKMEGDIRRWQSEGNRQAIIGKFETDMAEIAGQVETLSLAHHRTTYSLGGGGGGCMVTTEAVRLPTTVGPVNRAPWTMASRSNSMDYTSADSLDIPGYHGASREAKHLLLATPEAQIALPSVLPVRLGTGLAPDTLASSRIIELLPLEGTTSLPISTSTHFAAAHETPLLKMGTADVTLPPLPPLAAQKITSSSCLLCKKKGLECNSAKPCNHCLDFNTLCMWGEKRLPDDMDALEPSQEIPSCPSADSDEDGTSTSCSETDSFISGQSAIMAHSQDQQGCRQALLMQILQENNLRIVDVVLVSLRSRTSGSETDNSSKAAPPAPDEQTEPATIGRSADVNKRNREKGRSHGGAASSDEEKDDEEAPRRPPKRRFTEKLLSRRFACPFRQNSRTRHCSHRSCLGPGWPSVHRVKEHVYRRHAMPIHCDRCRKVFATRNELTHHLRVSKNNICELNAEEPVSGYSLDQERAMKCRKTRGLSEEEKWRKLYLVLFPECPEDDIPSPYYAEDPTMEELYRYEQYLEHEARRRTQEHLDADLLPCLRNLSSSLRHELLQQIPGFVREVQLDLFHSYRASRQSERPGPEDPIGNSKETTNDNNAIDSPEQHPISFIPPEAGLNLEVLPEKDGLELSATCHGASRAEQPICHPDLNPPVAYDRASLGKNASWELIPDSTAGFWAMLEGVDPTGLLDCSHFEDIAALDGDVRSAANDDSIFA